MNRLNVLIGLVAALLLSACDYGLGEIDLNVKVDTKCFDSHMSPVTFASVSGAELDTAYTSNQVNISGLAKGCTEPLWAGGNEGTSSINGGEFKSGRRTVKSGDRVRLRQFSPGTYGATSTWQTLNTVFTVATRPGRPADAPIVTILTPTDQATVNASRIIVSGVAEDPDGIVRIEVTRTAASYTEVVASSADGFATWQAEIALESGTNILKVSSTDALNNHDPLDADFDVDNGRVLILSAITSRYLARILTFDVATNKLTTLFSYTNSRPIQVARDPLNNRLLLLYYGANSIRAIDMATGDVSFAY